MKLAIAVIPASVCIFGVATAAVRSGGILGQAASANVETKREVEVDPGSQLASGRQSYDRMTQSGVVVRNALEQARAARDIVKTLCLTDKLNQIEVAIKAGKDRLLTLTSAAESKDKDRSRHELTILLALRDKVDQLAKEANQCIGEEAGFIGESQVSLQVDPNIPDNDPDTLGSDPDIISPPPPLSSPID